MTPGDWRSLAALLRDGFEHVGPLSTAPPAGPSHG
jgi:hypothetical protein